MKEWKRGRREGGKGEGRGRRGDLWSRESKALSWISKMNSKWNLARWHTTVTSFKKMNYGPV